MNIKQYRIPNTAIHCETVEEANILMKMLDEAGYYWSSGRSYSTSNNWNHYEENTCYSSSGGYAPIEHYIYENFTVFKFKDIYNKPNYFLSKNFIEKERKI